MEIIDGKAYLDDVKKLIIEYTTRLGRDLSFQNLDAELADPARKYTAPEGEILVAVEEDEVIGMVAYHRLSDTRCEMKRLYVTPKGRGKQTGDALVEKIIAHAEEAGYQEMVLDTIEPLRTAIHLYHKYGFAECDAYYENPMDDVIYMCKILKKSV